KRASALSNSGLQGQHEEAQKMRGESAIRDWDRVFDEFNSTYFEGKLPTYRIKISGRINRRDSVGANGYINRKSRTIYLQRDDNRNMRHALLHEMAHVATNDYHGKKFRNEMLRLAEDGAPIPEWELTEKGSQELTREHLENVCSDFFSSLPDIGVDHA